MKTKLRLAYLAITSAISGLALLGGIFCFFDAEGPGLLLISIAVSLIPPLSHLRMRRMLGALVGTTSGNISLGGAGQLRSDIAHLTSAFQVLSHKLESNDAKSTAQIPSNPENLERIANELRRESRMLRLLLEEERGKKV